MFIMLVTNIGKTKLSFIAQTTDMEKLFAGILTRINAALVRVKGGYKAQNTENNSSPLRLPRHRSMGDKHRLQEAQLYNDDSDYIQLDDYHLDRSFLSRNTAKYSAYSPAATISKSLIEEIKNVPSLVPQPIVQTPLLNLSLTPNKQTLSLHSPHNGQSR
jgi:hypothetical protein